MNELGLSMYLGADCLFRHQKKYAARRSAITKSGTITAAAMTPPLTVDLFVVPAVGAAVGLEEVDDDEEELESEVVVEVLNVDEVVVAVVDNGANVTAVKTICSFKSVGWPMNEVSMVVASDGEPHAHCEYPPGYAFR